MDQDISSIVAKGAEVLGIALPPEAMHTFILYYNFLESRGRNINLTAISGAEDVARLHFLDSLALLKFTQSISLQPEYEHDALVCHVPSTTGANAFAGTYNRSSLSLSARNTGIRLIDIGSGAGFPGIPLKIAEPEFNLTLLDATGKRAKFLTDLCAVLGVSAAIVHARAEEVSHRPDMRECFDIALSRGVARLNVLCELCLPFVRVGGTFLAMKSADSDFEISEALGAIETLGANLEDTINYTIPDTSIIHRVVIIKKTSSTPGAYPRRFARISNTPL